MVYKWYFSCQLGDGLCHLITTFYGNQFNNHWKISTWEGFNINHEMGVSKNRGGPPKWMVYNEKPYKNGWFGGTPFFWKHPYIYIFLISHTHLLYPYFSAIFFFEMKTVNNGGQSPDPRRASGKKTKAPKWDLILCQGDSPCVLIFYPCTLPETNSSPMISSPSFLVNTDKMVDFPASYVSFRECNSRFFWYNQNKWMKVYM